MNTFLFIGIVVVGLVCIIKANKWATAVQHYYVRETKRSYGKSFDWGQPWVRTLFKVMIIFAGILLLFAAYPLAFGPVHIQF